MIILWQNETQKVLCIIIKWKSPDDPPPCFSKISGEGGGHLEWNPLMQKKIIMIFWPKICSKRARIGPTAKSLYSQVRINIPYKPTNLIFGFWNMNFLITFCLTTCSHIVKQNVGKNFMFQNSKIKFVGLHGMLMRTRD